MADESKKSYSLNKETKGFGEFYSEFRRFFWNPETREFLHRTGESWFKIIVFYIFFFTGLISFFYLLLWIFLQTLDDKKPKWLGDEGLIGNSPGVGFRPMPNQDSMGGLWEEKPPLIEYKRGNGDDGGIWSNKLEEYFEKQSKKPQPCKSTSTANADTCNKANKWGYPEGKPCILIKLNKIYGWIPEPYSSSHKDVFPKDMPESVQEIISRDEDPKGKVWFSCNGTKSNDIENLGPVEYVPEQGISTCHFPYENQEGYKAPFIFLRLSNPKYNKLINIECKAWAKNIRRSEAGLVRFRVQID